MFRKSLIKPMIFKVFSFKNSRIRGVRSRVILGGFRFLDGGVKIRLFGFYTP